mmetsp:Transcript_9692/g.29458  ORF Transcript_9692/g.29458 Transcript_9692/m.29458 type:complete len:80 (+) Transcript_9692:68-307(+)
MLFCDVERMMPEATWQTPSRLVCRARMHNPAVHVETLDQLFILKISSRRVSSFSRVFGILLNGDGTSLSLSTGKVRNLN